MEGSKLYNQLLATAKDYFLNSIEKANNNHETRYKSENTLTILYLYCTPYVSEILS